MSIKLLYKNHWWGTDWEWETHDPNWAKRQDDRSKSRWMVEMRWRTRGTYGDRLNLGRMECWMNSEMVRQVLRYSQSFTVNGPINRGAHFWDLTFRRIFLVDRVEFWMLIRASCNSFQMGWQPRAAFEGMFISVSWQGNRGGCHHKEAWNGATPVEVLTREQCKCLR